MEPQIRHAPALRFPEFRDAWKYTSLSEISRVFDGTHQTPTYVVHGVPFVSVEDVENLRGTTKFITSEAFQKDFKIKPRTNDILMTRITAGVIGATAIVENDEPLGYYVSLALIRPNPDIDPHFLRQSILTPYFKRELHKRIIHVAFPKKINLGDIGECTQHVPSSPEQQKIAAFLSAVDEKIGQLASKKELLLKYKKCVMQEIFDQKIRFKDDDGNNFPDWEMKRIGDFAEVSAGATPSTLKPDYWDGDIRWMNSGELNLKHVSEVENRISELGLKKSSTRLLPRRCVLIGLAGQGKTRGTVAMNMIELCTNQSIAAIHPNPNVFIEDFLFHNLDTRYDELRSLSTGDGGRGGLNLQIIRSVKVRLPSVSEQLKIAGLFSSLDERIERVTLQLEKTKLFKKGLLQQMFV